MKRDLFLGEYPVIEASAASFTINLGRGTYITVHTLSESYNIKPGDKLPLYTQVPYASPQPTDGQSSH